MEIGSNHWAAIFRKIVQRIYFVKIIESTGRLAGERRQAFGYINIRTKFGYRYEGWPDAARFDANTLTAATFKIPEPPLQSRQLAVDWLCAQRRGLNNWFWAVDHLEGGFARCATKGVKPVPTDRVFVETSK